MLQWQQAAVDEALVNPVVVRITTSLLGVILVARYSLDQAQGHGAESMSSMCHLPPNGHSVMWPERDL